MRVGVFSPYFQTFGGGERYVLTVADFFLTRGDRVEIFWDGENNLSRIKNRFDIDLSKARFIPDIFRGKSNFLQKLEFTRNYDLIFFLSDGSIPFSLARKNILHFQQPFHYANQNNLINMLKLSRFQAIVCNSRFTKKYIDKTYGIKSRVLYPPVDVDKFASDKKENIILSVGRFFGPMHPKKHETLVNTFKAMKLSNWKLVIVGGLAPGSENSLERLKKITGGHPITLVTNSSFHLLSRYYAAAKIYWHATGFGQDLKKFPERAEHFGITTVEAMSAGCVPIVFAGGGQREIVTEGKNGYFWTTTRQLIAKTEQLVNDEGLRQELAAEAIVRSKNFSKAKFFLGLDQLLNI